MKICVPFNEFQDYKYTTVEVIFNVSQIYLWHEFKNPQQEIQCLFFLVSKKKNKKCLLKLIFKS